MPYLHCTFTLVMRNASVHTPGSEIVLPTIRPNAEYPLRIHTSRDERCAHTHSRNNNLVTTIRTQAVFRLNILVVVMDGSVVTYGPRPVMPKIRPHAVYQLRIHISVEDYQHSHTQQDPESQKRPHSVYPFHIHIRIDGPCGLSYGPDL